MDLSEVSDSRSFLKLALNRIQTENPKFGYAALVRKAGLASRSFPRDVILGRKSLTSESAKKLAQALRLTSDQKELFVLLAGRDVLEKNQENTEKLSKRIQKLKARIHQKLDSNLQNSKNSFYEKKGWIEVWASLPSQDQNANGASLVQIAKRSGLPEKTCRKIIDEFIEKNLVKHNPETDGFFIAQSAHVIMGQLGESQFFKSWFLDSLGEAKKSATEHFKSENHLFLNSVFLVKSENLPKFNKELRELMIRYIDQSEDPEGDQLARLSVSLF